MTKKYINDLAFELVGCAIEVNKQLGPGLFKSKKLYVDLRLDVLVENLVVCELKG